jgi:hypothetical protein
MGWPNWWELRITEWFICIVGWVVYIEYYIYKVEYEKRKGFFFLDLDKRLAACVFLSERL